MKMSVILGIAMMLGAEVGFPQPPLGLDLYMPVPETNPLTRDKAALGRRLFFDKGRSNHPIRRLALRSLCGRTDAGPE